MAALEASNDLAVQKNLILADYPLIDELGCSQARLKNYYIPIHYHSAPMWPAALNACVPSQ